MPVKTSSGIFGLFGEDNKTPEQLEPVVAPVDTSDKAPDGVSVESGTDDPLKSKSGSESSPKGDVPPTLTISHSPETPHHSPFKSSPPDSRSKISSIVHPEAIHALFELIKFAENEGMTPNLIQQPRDVIRT